MGSDGVDDFLGLAVSAKDFYADFNMAAFHVMVQRFADIVEQPCSPRNFAVDLQFVSHHASEVRYFNGMVEDILTVTGSELEPTEQLQQTFWQVINPCSPRCFLTSLQDSLLHLLPRLLHNFFNSGRVDSPVSDEHFQSQPSRLPPDWVKAGNHDGFGRIVND
jgi:hypothetical protein